MQQMALVNGVRGCLMSCQSRMDSKSCLLNPCVQIQPLSMATSGYVLLNTSTICRDNQLFVVRKCCHNSVKHENCNLCCTVKD